MKKILALILAATTALSLAACSTKVSAYDLYSKMTDAQKEVTSMAMDMTMTINMTVDGQEMDLMTMKGSTKQVIRSQTDVDMEMVMSTEMMGESMAFTSYYKDGTLYQQVGDAKIKMAVPLDQATQMAANTDLQFEEDAIKTSTVSKADGGQKLSFSLDPDKMTEMTQNLLDTLSGSMGEVGDIDIKISKIDYDVVLNSDNLPTKMLMNFDAKMEAQGETVEAKYVVDATISSYNSIDAIDFPADLDSYIG